VTQMTKEEVIKKIDDAFVHIKERTLLTQERIQKFNFALYHAKKFIEGDYEE